MRIDTHVRDMDERVAVEGVWQRPFVTREFPGATDFRQKVKASGAALISCREMNVLPRLWTVAGEDEDIEASQEAQEEKEENS